MFAGCRSGSSDGKANLPLPRGLSLITEPGLVAMVGEAKADAPEFTIDKTSEQGFVKWFKALPQVSSEPCSCRALFRRLAVQILRPF